MKYQVKFFRGNDIAKVKIIEGYLASYKPWAFTYCHKVKCYYGYDRFEMELIEG